MTNIFEQASTTKTLKTQSKYLDTELGRLGLLTNQDLDPKLQLILMNDSNATILCWLAQRSDLLPEVQEYLATHSYLNVRLKLVANEYLLPTVQRLLAKDRDLGVIKLLVYSPDAETQWLLYRRFKKSIKQYHLDILQRFIYNKYLVAKIYRKLVSTHRIKAPTNMQYLISETQELHERYLMLR